MFVLFSLAFTPRSEPPLRLPLNLHPDIRIHGKVHNSGIVHTYTYFTYEVHTINIIYILNQETLYGLPQIKMLSLNE